MRKIMTDLLLLVGGAVVLALGGYQFGVNIGTERTRQAAIDSGMAQWTIDPKTGDKRFEFKIVPPGSKIIPLEVPELKQGISK